jgi:hypothetical protein
MVMRLASLSQSFVGGNHISRFFIHHIRFSLHEVAAVDNLFSKIETPVFSDPTGEDRKKIKPENPRL